MKPIAVFIFLLCASAAIAQPGKQFYTKIGFENNSGFQLDTSSNNIWKRGKNFKYKEDTSRAVSYVMVTDTLNSYPTNNQSSFQINIPVKKDIRYTNLLIWHRFNMDTLKDFGRIDASYDNGNTWKSIRELTSENPDINNKSFGRNQSEVITGNSNGWKFLFFRWYWRKSQVTEPEDSMHFIPKNILVKFSFSSDDIDNKKEGWMIDEILVEEAKVALDSCAPGFNKNYYPSPYPQKRNYTYNGANYGSNIWIESYDGAVMFKDIQDKSKGVKPITLPAYPPQKHFLIIKTGTGEIEERMEIGKFAN